MTVLLLIVLRFWGLLEKILTKDAEFYDFAVEHDFPQMGKRKVLLNARRITQKSSNDCPLVTSSVWVWVWVSVT